MDHFEVEMRAPAAEGAGLHVIGNAAEAYRLRARGYRETGDTIEQVNASLHNQPPTAPAGTADASTTSPPSNSTASSAAPEVPVPDSGDGATGSDESAGQSQDGKSGSGTKTAGNGKSARR